MTMESEKHPHDMREVRTLRRLQGKKSGEEEENEEVIVSVRLRDLAPYWTWSFQHY